MATLTKSAIATIITGRWRVLRIDERDPGDAEPGVKAYIDFHPRPVSTSEFGFDGLHGNIDYRLGERDNKPAVEWTWREDGADLHYDWGRGWAVADDGKLKGRFFVHRGPEWSFVGARLEDIERASRGKAASANPTSRQAEYLAFILHYTKVNGQPPAETDMQRYFGTSPPTIHQMVLTLERRGFIQRTPGTARSIRVLPPRDGI